jgi:hypothetical protein
MSTTSDIQFGEASHNVLGALSSVIPEIVVRSIITNLNTDLGGIESRIEHLIDTLQDVSSHVVMCFSIFKTLNGCRSLVVRQPNSNWRSPHAT